MKTSTQQTRGRTLLWLEGGGPFVILPRDRAASWRGLKHDDGPSDFDRACDVDDYLGLMAHDGVPTLVLGDDPFPTTYLPAPAFGGGYIVRILWGDDRDAAIEAVHSAASSAWTPEEFTFSSKSGELMLFDAAHPAESAPKSITIKLGPGPYAIATANIQPDESMCLLVHRFVPLA